MGCSSSVCRDAVTQYNISLKSIILQKHCDGIEDWWHCEPISCAVHHISGLPLSMRLCWEGPGCDIQPTGWQCAAVWVGVTAQL